MRLVAAMLVAALSAAPAAMFIAALSAAPAAAESPPAVADAGATSRLRVVATIEPLAMLLREVGGARLEIAVLVPPGASPHTFEPQPSDVGALARAALVAEVGGGLDGWLRHLLGAASTQPALFTAMQADGLAPLPADPTHGEPAGQPDPHVWLDPLRVRDAIVPALVTQLVSLDPAGRASYEAAARAFGESLTALDAEIRATLADRARTFVSFHAAWRYFAERFGLVEVGVVEEAPGEEPTPRELGTLVERARAESVGAILVEPQLSPRIARVLASEFGATTVLVDPNGDPSAPERDTYADLMRFNARAFAQALGAAKP